MNWKLLNKAISINQFRNVYMLHNVKYSNYNALIYYMNTQLVEHLITTLSRTKLLASRIITLVLDNL